MTRCIGFLALRSFPFLLLLVLGCGGKTTATVEGVVTVGGKPLPMGEVVLATDDGKVVSAPIGPSGEFKLTGAPIGSVSAAVSFLAPSMSKNPLDPFPGQPPSAKPQAAPPGNAPPGQEMPPDVKERMKAAEDLLKAVSPEYRDVKKSPLKYTLVAGANKITVEVPSGKGPGKPPQ